MWEVKVLVPQLFLTLCDPSDCIPAGSSVHGLSQARILEWYCSGLSFLSPGDLPEPGIEFGSPALQADSLLSERGGQSTIHAEVIEQSQKRRPSTQPSDHLAWAKEKNNNYLRSSIQLLSRVWLFVTPWTAAGRASLSITNSQSLLKLMSITSVMPSNHLILCCPLLLLPSILPSIMVFSNESVLHLRWPKYWSFSFSPSNEYSGLTSFRMNCFDLLAVQGALKSLLQHHSSKASILQCSTFFIVQLSHSIHDYSIHGVKVRLSLLLIKGRTTEKLPSGL